MVGTTPGPHQYGLSEAILGVVDANVSHVARQKRQASDFSAEGTSPALLSACTTGVMRILFGIVVVFAAVTVGMNVLARTDPGVLVKIEEWSGQAGKDKKSVQWVQDWLRQEDLNGMRRAPGARCTTGTNGWDYQCTAWHRGTQYHFGAYVLRLPTGEDVVQESGWYLIDQPIGPAPK